MTNQAIVLDAWDGAELPAIPELEAADLESATSLLNWEYEQVFGLDFARSYASPEIEADIDNRLSLHEKRIEVLQGAIGKSLRFRNRRWLINRRQLLASLFPPTLLRPRATWTNWGGMTL